MKRRIPGGLLLAALAGAAIATGCGDDDENTAASTTASTTTAAQTAGGSGGAGGGGSMSAGEWAKEADAICEKGDRKIDAEGRKLFENLGLTQAEQPSPSQVERFVDDAVERNPFAGTAKVAQELGLKECATD